VTTFWLTFTDPEATSDKRFLGVAIFDMDEGEGELSTAEIIKHAYALGPLAVTHPRQEPYAGKPHVRICAGGVR